MLYDSDLVGILRYSATLVIAAMWLSCAGNKTFDQKASLLDLSGLEIKTATALVHQGSFRTDEYRISTLPDEVDSLVGSLFENRLGDDSSKVDASSTWRDDYRLRYFDTHLHDTVTYCVVKGLPSRKNVVGIMHIFPTNKATVTIEVSLLCALLNRSRFEDHEFQSVSIDYRLYGFLGTDLWIITDLPL